MLDSIYYMSLKLLNKRAIVALNRPPVLCAPVIYAYVTPREAHFLAPGALFEQSWWWTTR